MNTRVGALLVSALSLTLTGCSMYEESNDVPFAGSRTSSAASDQLEGISSEIYDLIGIKGERSDSRAGIMDCAGKDQEKYFRVFHPWSFYPSSPGQLDEAMKRLSRSSRSTAGRSSDTALTAAGTRTSR